MKKTLAILGLALMMLLVGCATASKEPVDIFAIDPHRPPVMPETYTVHRVSDKIAPKLLLAGWEDPRWEAAETLTLKNFRPESKFYYVTIQAKFLHDGKNIYAIYHTDNDRFVIATHFLNNSDVCLDTCVEFFFQPQGAKWYGNCEFSLSGAYLTMFHPDAQNPWMGECYLAPEHQALVKMYSIYKRIILPEMPGPVEWAINFKIPMEAYEPYGGPIGDLSGQKFMANFYHCADLSSHPRWVSWAPLPYLAYHIPECFQEIIFE
ncbi:MAG: hypothetical protein IKR13_06845 [Victivallales bacterium]|nr:hypothetical protein [Victivallales bacterium]